MWNLCVPGFTDLFQVTHHLVLVTVQYAAEEFDDLLVVEVVNAFYYAWEEQLHGQVEISFKLVFVGGTAEEKQVGLVFSWQFFETKCLCAVTNLALMHWILPPPEPFFKKSLIISVFAL